MGNRAKCEKAKGWLVVVAACFLMGAPRFAQMQVSPLAGDIMSAYGLDQVQYLSVFTAANLSPVFLSLIAGILLDHFGSKRVVFIAAMITAIGCVARVFVLGYVPFYCSSILIGVVSSFIVTGATKIMAQYFPVDKISLPVGILYAAVSVSSFIATATAAFFETTIKAFSVSAIIAIFSAVLWVIVVPEEKRSSKTISYQSQVSDIFSGLKDVLTCKGVYLTMIALLCLGVISFGLSGMLPTMLADKGLDTQEAGLTSSIRMIGTLIGSIFMPAIIERSRNDKLLIAALCIAIMILSPCIMLAPTGPVLWTVLFLEGIAVYGLVPVFMSFPILMPKVGVKNAATASGIITTIQSLGIVIIPSGVLVPISSGNYVIYALLLSILAAITLICGLLINIPKKTNV